MTRQHRWMPRCGAAIRHAFVVTVATVALLSPACRSGPPASERSIILVTLDTTRVDRIGAYGGTAVPTPNLDSVARQGVLFREAISQVPLTLPAHSSILTGRYPSAHGVRHNGIYRLPPSAETLTERLRDAGYETAAFVAAYVLNRGYGTEQGFDVYDDVPVNRFEGGQDQLFEAQRTADEVNARVFRWLRNRGDGKFFLWVHYYDPHDPYDPPATPGRTLEGEGYDREISYLDHCFGDLMDRLGSDGVLDRSILMVVGDHGESLGEHRERTHGMFLYEAAVRVPMFLRAPGLVPAGTEVDGPVQLVDVAPTLLELAELPPLENAQGESRVAGIGGDGGGVDRLAFAETLMPRLEFGASELTMVRTRGLKYIEAPRPELYDLRDDPHETTNLASTDPETVEEMALLLAEWMTATAIEGVEGEASRTLSPEELARLQSLGYMDGGSLAGDSGDGSRPDPKDIIDEIRRLDTARDRLADGHPQDAVEAVDDILTANPLNHNARATRIMALIELGRFADAEEEARAGLTLAESDTASGEVVQHKLQGLLAGAHRLQNENDEAETLYREMLERDPEDDNAAVDLARLLVDTGRVDEAVSILESVLVRNPRHGLALAARFRAEDALGRDDAMLVTARALAEARVGDPDTLARAGDVLMNAGMPADAVAAYEVAQDQVDLDPALLARLGSAQVAAGRLDDAIPVFEAVASLAPADPRPYYYLGNIALMKGDENAARAQFDHALARGPTFTAPQVSLARWLASEGRADDARKTLEDALRRNPRDARAREVLESLPGAK